MGNQPSVNGGENDAQMAQGGQPPQQGGYGGGAGYGGAGGPHHQTPFSQTLSYHDAPAYDTKQQSSASQRQQQQQQHMMGARGGAATGAAGDTSMPMDADGHAGSGANSKLEGSWLDDDTVPTVFRWEHGGRQVYITGTFNGWSRQIPMHRSGNDFTYIHNLKRGKHAFKFIVDDEWRFAPDQPTVADIEGRINNFIDVTDFKPYTGDKDFEKEKAAAEYGGCALGSDGEQKQEDVGEGKDAGADADGEVFSQNIPDFDEYTKEPPPLPPHLRHIILNKPPQLQDTAALPVPQHVALNHLYCTAIRDNMMVLGITQRYKTKFVTTVYYSPCASK